MKDPNWQHWVWQHYHMGNINLLGERQDCCQCESVASYQIQLPINDDCSSTGIAANYAEACEAESAKDFVHKLKIAMKELAETRIWLKLIVETGYVENAKLDDLIAESKELSRILSASVTTTKKKMEC